METRQVSFIAGSFQRPVCRRRNLPEPKEVVDGASFVNDVGMDDEASAPSRRSFEQRRAAGKELRKEYPRRAHRTWSASRDRRDPIEVLEEQAETRAAELVPIRYGRMAQSPFAFFRGGAAIMAMDLATTPTTGLYVQACGDAHVNNFGKFATPERNVMFDVNDFDETLPGPWEWDVKRLCTSLYIVARERRVLTVAIEADRRAGGAHLSRADGRGGRRCGRSTSGTTASTSTT